MKALAIIRIKMVVSVVKSMVFFSLAVKRPVVSVVSVPSHDFAVFKHSLKTVHTIS